MLITWLLHYNKHTTILHIKIVYNCIQRAISLRDINLFFFFLNKPVDIIQYIHHTVNSMQEVHYIPNTATHTLLTKPIV